MIGCVENVKHPFEAMKSLLLKHNYPLFHQFTLANHTSVCEVSYPPKFSGLSWSKIGMQCFRPALFVVHGRKPPKPHLHGLIRGWVNEEERRNQWRFFQILSTLIKRNQDKNCWKFLECFWRNLLSRCLVSMFGCRFKSLTVSWRQKHPLEMPTGRAKRVFKDLMFIASRVLYGLKGIKFCFMTETSMYFYIFLAYYWPPER